ncbi:AAA family ATPase [Mumia xiangluensis]|uniref:CpaE family protein n=1 Tax=Mumia xiangluensis TaxID=1678900 RepID=A0ABW1QPV9_9ACTN
MSVPVLIAAGGEPWEADLVAAAVATDGIDVVRRCVDVANAVATAPSGSVGVALVSVGLPGLDADAVRRLAGTDVLVVAVVGGHETEQAARQHAGALGIASVVPWTRLREVPALARATRRDGGAELDLRPSSAERDDAAVPVSDHQREGRITAVWGPPGAPGRSTVARGIAAELAAYGRRTVLIDADVDGGTQAAALALLDEVSGILVASRDANSGTLTRESLTACLRWIGPELGVLTGLPRADRWPSLRAAAYESVLETAREVADDVVVDLGHALDDADEPAYDSAAPRRAAVARHTLAVADRVIVVGSPDPVGLSRLARAVLDVRSRLGIEPDVVINRMRPTLGWSAREIADAVERFTGLRPLAFLPDAPAVIDHCLVHGYTTVEGAAGSPFRTTLVTLVDQLRVQPA